MAVNLSLADGAIQLGTDGTATNNFVLRIPSTPDGTISLARGNDGATSSDIITVGTLANGGGVGIRGTGTNDSAATGFVGEYVSTRKVFVRRHSA